MITRITKLRGYDNILAGRDLANIFEEGHVYQVGKVLGEIIFKDLGLHAESKHLGNGRGTISQIITEGVYCLTREEFKKEVECKNKKSRKAGITNYTEECIYK